MEKGEMGENATGRLTTYYVAECMEFNRYGEYREDIHSAEEAVKIYQSIPSERLNAGKGFMWRKKMVFHWNFPWFITGSWMWIF